MMWDIFQRKPILYRIIKEIGLFKTNYESNGYECPECRTKRSLRFHLEGQCFCKFCHCEFWQARYDTWNLVEPITDEI